MKKLLIPLLFASTILFQTSSCKKDKTTVNTCGYDACDPKRKTVVTANDWTGQLGYYNELRKWAVNYHLPGTYDSAMTCIICSEIPDSLKSIGKTVVFSGDIKEGCGNPKATFYGQGIFYINPTKIK